MLDDSEYVTVPIKRKKARQLLNRAVQGRGVIIRADDIHGDGFGSFMRKAGRVAKSAAQSDIAKAVASKGVQLGSQYAGNAVAAYTGNEALGNLAGQAAGMAGQAAANRATGQGFGKFLKRAGRVVKSAVQSDVARGLVDVGSNVAGAAVLARTGNPMLAQMAAQGTQVAGRAATGGGVHERMARLRAIKAEKAAAKRGGSFRLLN